MFCDSADFITARRLEPRRASGATLVAHASEDAWHRDAAGWWAGLLTGEYALEDAEAAVPAHGDIDLDAHPPDRPAAGVTLRVRAPPPCQGHLSGPSAPLAA